MMTCMSMINLKTNKYKYFIIQHNMFIVLQKVYETQIYTKIKKGHQN